jgi:lipase
LSMTFPDRATYLDFWKEHPAFAADRTGDVLEGLADYASYDLNDPEPLLRPSTSLEAVRQDSMDQFGGGVVQAALKGLRKPVSLLTAPRGLLNKTPG